MSTPVVVVPSGGFPVTESISGIGLPVTVVTAYGRPVTQVASGGFPVVGLDTGSSVGPNYRVVSRAANFTLNGQSANLVYHQLTQYTMQALPGAFVFTGEGMTPLNGYMVQAGAGAFALAGQSATVPGAAAFTPANLANLYAWYKADAGVLKAGLVPATANNDVVVQWNDQSGVSNINLAAGGVANGVTFLTNVLSGKPVVAASAASMFGTMSLGGSAVSVWAVVKCASTSSGRAAGYGGASTSDTNADAFIAWFYPNTTSASAYQNGVKSTATIVDQSWNSIMSVWGDPANPGFNTLYVNGAGITPVASSPTFAASGRFTMFNAANDGNPLTGYIAELVVVKGAFSAAERASLAAYSLARWGV